jgi:hypothetical protein
MGIAPGKEKQPGLNLLWETRIYHPQICHFTVSLCIFIYSIICWIISSIAKKQIQEKLSAFPLFAEIGTHIYPSSFFPLYQKGQMVDRAYTYVDLNYNNSCSVS